MSGFVSHVRISVQCPDLCPLSKNVWMFVPLGKNVPKVTKYLKSVFDLRSRSFRRVLLKIGPFFRFFRKKAPFIKENYK